MPNTADDVVKLTPEMQAAWAHWEPAFDPEPPLTVRQSSYVREAFFAGWFAALTNTAPLVEALEKARAICENDALPSSAQVNKCWGVVTQALSQYNGKGDRI